MFESGQKLYADLMTNPVIDNFEILMKVLAKYPEGGRTALGPALVAALGLASQVIISRIWMGK